MQLEIFLQFSDKYSKIRQVLKNSQITDTKSCLDMPLIGGDKEKGKGKGEKGLSYFYSHTKIFFFSVLCLFI